MRSERANREALSAPGFDRDSAQALKGIAILMMLFHHCFRESAQYENYVISFAPFPESKVVALANMCKICVSLFAFVSGYGLYLSCCKRKGSPGQWVLERYIKTFSGYWLIWVLSAVITQGINHRVTWFFHTDKSIWQGIAEAAVDFSGTALLFNTPTLNGTWWYMSAAFVFIVLMGLLWENIRDRPWLVWLSSIILIRILFSEHAEYAFTGETSVYAFVSVFLFGALCANCGLVDRWLAVGRGSGAARALKFGLEVAALALSYCFYQHVPIEQYWELHYNLIAFLVILFCVEYITPIPRVRQLLMYLGRHSMNIFCVHTFIRVFYANEFTYSWKHFALVVLVLLLDSLALSILLEWLKKLTGYNALMERLLKKIA